MTLPNWLFVVEKDNGDGSKYLDATREQGENVDDDGATETVGNYKLIKKVKMRKEVRLVLPEPRKRKH